MTAEGRTHDDLPWEALALLAALTEHYEPSRSSSPEMLYGIGTLCLRRRESASRIASYGSGVPFRGDVSTCKSASYLALHGQG